MTADEIRPVVVRLLTRVAPEARELVLSPTVALRDQLDLDSMDMLNFVIALHEELKVDIPETDYAKLATLDSAAAYLADRVNTREPPRP